MWNYVFFGEGNGPNFGGVIAHRNIGGCRWLEWLEALGAA